MNKIPTAEEFFAEHCVEMDSTVAKQMIEFTKMHVKAALKAAAETNYPSTKANFELVNSRILNAYPLTNIK